MAASAVARDLHLLIEDLVTTDPGSDALTAIGRHVTAARQELATHERSRYWERGGSGADYRLVSPYCGEANPVASPMTMRTNGSGTDAKTSGAAVIPPIFEGPPGSVHGGYMAGLFDELMGATQAAVGPRAGLTGRLSVRYRRPTPTERPLELTSWIHKTGPAYTTVRAECRSDGVVTAEAEGLFIRSRRDVDND